jgi:hypothetical protein
LPQRLLFFGQSSNDISREIRRFESFWGHLEQSVLFERRRPYAAFWADILEYPAKDRVLWLRACMRLANYLLGVLECFL